MINGNPPEWIEFGSQSDWKDLVSEMQPLMKQDIGNVNIIAVSLLNYQNHFVFVCSIILLLAMVGIIILLIPSVVNKRNIVRRGKVGLLLYFLDKVFFIPFYPIFVICLLLIFAFELVLLFVKFIIYFVKKDTRDINDIKED